MNERKWQQPRLEPPSPVVEGSQVSWHITVYCTVSLRKMMKVCYELFKLFVNSKCTKHFCFPITFLCVLHAQSVRFCFILITSCNTATIQIFFFFKSNFRSCAWNSEALCSLRITVVHVDTSENMEPVKITQERGWHWEYQITLMCLSLSAHPRGFNHTWHAQFPKRARIWISLTVAPMDTIY